MMHLLFPLLAACTGAPDDSDTKTEETGVTEETGDTTETGETGDSEETGETGETGTMPDEIAIAGAWYDNWGGQHEVDEAAWHSGSSAYAITQFGEDWAVAQNDAANDWNPGLWSRFDWGWSDSALYYCQTAYAAESEAAALGTAAADIGNLTGGCGGFSWSELRAPLGIDGAWNDGWGGTHEINPFTWVNGDSSYAVSAADADNMWLVAQNSAANPWNPGLWSRFDWTWDGDGTLWYCQTAYDKATEAEALASPAADPADPATTGCGGFSWTSMEPA